MADGNSTMADGPTLVDLEQRVLALEADALTSSERELDRSNAMTQFFTRQVRSTRLQISLLLFAIFCTFIHLILSHS